MQVNLPGISLETVKQLPSPIRSWMLGQLLDASVIGRDDRNSIRLRLGGVEVRAATALPLQLGDKLSLRVTQLRPIVMLAPVKPAQPPQEQQLRAAMRLALPKQRPLGPLLDQLTASIKTDATGQGNDLRLPVAVVLAAHRLLRTVPRVIEASDPTRLRAVIRRTGSFFESTVDHRISNGETALPAQDLKWQLLRFRSVLRSALGHVPSTDADSATVPARTPTKASPATTAPDRAPPRLVPSSPLREPTPITETSPRIATNLPIDTNAKTPNVTVDPSIDLGKIRALEQHVDGAIAKIETNQLKTVSSIFDGNLHLFLDLPIAVGDTHKVIRVRISQDESNEYDGDAPTTTFLLELPIEDDAILRAIVSLSAQKMSVKLWSTNSRLRVAIAAHYDVLAERLSANGLENVTISLVELKPFDKWGKNLEQLVDVKA